MGAGSAGGGEAASPSGELTAEVILNAAVAFAGHVAAAAQQAAGNAGDTQAGDTQAGGGPPAPVREAVMRQYLLETATLSLRRLGESYAEAAADPEQEQIRDLLRDGAARARAATAAVEALGDLGLDTLDRLLG